MPTDIDWLLVGDFNLIRYPENRNRPGGDVQEMLLFNEAISSLGLTEIPLQGRKFTWSNKQDPPLVEKLDWFFTSVSWTISYRNTSASSLVMEPSDHVPCIIDISTDIPKGKIFSFENYWMEHECFLDVVSHGWSCY
jgi:endonuclease/exonuclease/phosphatase family metal-dependent hydrolase